MSDEPTADTKTSVPRSRARSEKKVTITEKTDSIYFYEIEVEDPEGVFVERFQTRAEVIAYLRGLDAGTFPAQIEILEGWR